MGIGMKRVKDIYDQISLGNHKQMKSNGEKKKNTFHLQS